MGMNFKLYRGYKPQYVSVDRIRLTNERILIVETVCSESGIVVCPPRYYYRNKSNPLSQEMGKHLLAFHAAEYLGSHKELIKE